MKPSRAVRGGASPIGLVGEVDDGETDSAFSWSYIDARCATVYFVTELRRPGVSSAGIASSTS